MLPMLLYRSLMSAISGALKYMVKPKFLRKIVSSSTSSKGMALYPVQVDDTPFAVLGTGDTEKNSSSSISFNTNVYSSRKTRMTRHSSCIDSYFTFSNFGGSQENREAEFCGFNSWIAASESRLIVLKTLDERAACQKYLMVGIRSPEVEDA